MPYSIRQADSEDAPALCALIRELAVYEKLADHCHADPEKLAAHLAPGAAPGCHALLAETDRGEAAGFALYYWSYSTFLTDWGIYLEDLFVRTAHRGHGVGYALLASLARRVVDRGGDRLTWQVLDWNTLAIGFYGSLGARTLSDWDTMRLDGQALQRVSATCDQAAERIAHSGTI